MKIFLFFLLSISIGSKGYSQNSILPQINLTSGSKTLFKGLANEIELSTPPINGKFSIQVDSGEIKIIGVKKYIIPKSTGKLIVKVTADLDNQKVTQIFYFNCVEAINPQISFSKENGDVIAIKNKMSKQEIKEITKIIFNYPTNNIGNEVLLQSMKIVSVQSNSKGNQIEAENNGLKNDLSKVLNQLKKGSFLIFKDILVLITDSNVEKTLENICIEIE